MAWALSWISKNVLRRPSSSRAQEPLDTSPVAAWRAEEFHRAADLRMTPERQALVDEVKAKARAERGIA